ncbi:MAG: 30S ribosomal protein S15 [Candidatus Caldarchaeum sp.]|nr:30S ribosomal protein S15 [Candidatus Caldarchaeum sp.]
MARMHASKRGKSGSTRPLSKITPPWVKLMPEEVEALVVKYAKEGHPPSEIGVILRDQHGVPLVKTVTGKTVLQILAENNLRPPVPEDLSHLLEKIRRMRLHLERNKSDGHNIHRLQLVESKVRRLVKYYKSKGLLPLEYDPLKA